MKGIKLLAVATLLLSLTAGPVAAAGSVRVKLATLAPDGSPWHKLLKDMGNDWQRLTGGRVRLIIYPGGVAGTDSDMVRKMRIGQLQAGALTSGGLSDIDPAFNLFTIPLFFDSYEEYSYVLRKMTPVLKRHLESKGFILLHWGHGGWIHIFSKRPVRTVDDLRRVKMFTSAGDDRMVQIWKSNGFRPVALASTDILVGLQSGLIEGVPVPPLGALAMQWYRHIPYMLDPGVAPLVGGTVISNKAWSNISEQDRAAMLEAARRTEERLAVEIPEKDASSVTEMEKRGLTVIRVNPHDENGEWRATAKSFADKMRTTFVPEDIFDLALRHRTEFRENRSREGSR